MDSITKRIFQYLEDKLAAVEEVRSAVLGAYEPTSLQLPAVGILPDEESSEFADMDEPASHEETLDLVVRIIVDKNAEKAGYVLEDARRACQMAVLADPSLGGVALLTKKVGTKWLFLDAEYPRAGCDLKFRITYFTAETDSAQQ